MPDPRTASSQRIAIGSGRLRYVLGHPWAFTSGVISGFRANQGFLLAGAVAYYTLLSIVPMLAIILISLSQLVEVQLLLDTTREYLVLVAPGQADNLTAQVAASLHDWKLVGSLGLVMLLLFSSFAFTTLENAMSVIFFHRVAIHRRHFLVSAIIPYCYILCLALGMFLVSTVSGMLHGVNDESFTLLGYTWSLQGHNAGIIYALGVTGEILAVVLALPGDADRAACLAPCPDRWHYGDRALGADAAFHGVVFLHPVDRQLHLRYLRHGGDPATQSRGGGCHPAVRRPGNFGLRTH